MKKSRSMLAKVKLRDKRHLVIYYRNKRWPTKISISSKDEFSNGLLTSNYRGPEDYKELNIYLIERLQFFNNLIIDGLKKNADTLDYINSHLKHEEKKLKCLSITNNTSISKAFKEYLDIKKNGFQDFKSKKSFERYLSELSRIKDFDTIHPSTIADLDMDWIYEFCRFLSKPYSKVYNVIDSKNDREYQVTKVLKQENSTIKRFLQDIITFLNFLIDGQPELSFPIDEITKHMNSLSTPKENAQTIIALTTKQYDAFKNYKPRNLEWEVKTYDLFRFCINTGLRFSDVVSLYDLFITENNEIEMNAQKTSVSFSVLMNEDATRIFEKYGRDFRGKFPCNQQINVNLRKILKRIPEFNSKTKAYKFVLGQMKVEEVVAHEIITFHASRRTFVSRCIKRGATIDQIKKWTGWTDLRTLIHYMKIFGDSTNTDRAILS